MLFCGSFWIYDFGWYSIDSKVTRGEFQTTENLGWIKNFFLSLSRLICCIREVEKCNRHHEFTPLPTEPQLNEINYLFAHENWKILWRFQSQSSFIYFWEFYFSPFQPREWRASCLNALAPCDDCGRTDLLLLSTATERSCVKHIRNKTKRDYAKKEVWHFYCKSFEAPETV